MCALIATSMAGVAKKEKRGLLGLGDAAFNGGFAHHEFAHGLSAAPLIQAHHAPLFAAEHTHSVQRVNVPVPYPVERINEQIIPVDRPVPQPYPVHVIKHVPEPVHIEKPYPVEVKVPFEQPIAVPVERLRTVVKQVQVPQPYERQIPQVSLNECCVISHSDSIE